ncbi:MAG: tRNA (adenosine(37)-N6)-threonylcarbamoyltransferase complex transferase subunit TsaD [Elusimicrobiota bacterium]
MKILALESTCDETSVAFLNGRKIEKNLVYSQIKIHRKYKGVVPEAASRAHSEKMAALLKKITANSKKPQAITFCRGPGLNGSLIVSAVAAKTLSEYYAIPLIGVNHLEGHFLSCEIENDEIKNKFKFPLIVLIASGGHSELWLAENYGIYKLLGSTRDDAAGEAFDKTAKLLGFPYPGGPILEREALKASKKDFSFPIPFVREGFDFSFSGLKTAVAYKLDGKKLSIGFKRSVCYAFQEAAVDALLKKTAQAAEKYKVKQIAVGGGVSANGRLREAFTSYFKGKNIETLFPQKKYCSDNAAMAGLCAFRRLEAGEFKNCVSVNADLKIESWRKKC